MCSGLPTKCWDADSAQSFPQTEAGAPQVFPSGTLPSIRTHPDSNNFNNSSSLCFSPELFVMTKLISTSMTAANEFRCFIPFPSVLLQIDFLCQILQLPFPANKLVLRYLVVTSASLIQAGGKYNMYRCELYVKMLLLPLPPPSFTLLNYREMLS